MNSNALATLQRVADELEIMRVLAALAQAIDDRDIDAYRDCFHDCVFCPSDDHRDTGLFKTVPSGDYARSAVQSVSAFDWSYHCLSNFVVIVNGDQATAKVDVAVQLQSSVEARVAEVLTIGGRYYLELARFSVGWRITKRDRRTRFTIGDTRILEALGGN